MKCYVFILLVLICFSYSCQEECFCENQDCEHGYLCDEELEECVCPPASYYIDGGNCTLKDSSKFFPIGIVVDSNCKCIERLSMIEKVDGIDIFTNEPFSYLTTRVSTGSSIPEGNIISFWNNNTGENEEYQYFNGYFGNALNNLPCEIEGMPINGHLYFNYNSTEIEFLIQMFEFNSVNPYDDSNMLEECKFQYRKHGI